MKKGHYSNECTEELPTATEKKGTSLLINKEDSSDKELEDGQYEREEEDASMSSEEHELDNQENMVLPKTTTKNQMTDRMKKTTCSVMMI